MNRLSHSEVIARYWFDPVSACVPQEGVRRYGDEVEPLFTVENVDLFHQLIEDGAVRA